MGSFCCFQYRFYMKQVNLWCVLLVLRIRCASGLLSHYMYPSTFILCYGHLALLIDYYALQGLLERYEYSLWFSQSIEAPGVESAGGGLAGHRSRRFCLWCDRAPLHSLQGPDWWRYIPMGFKVVASALLPATTKSARNMKNLAGAPTLQHDSSRSGKWMATSLVLSLNKYVFGMAEIN